MNLYGFVYGISIVDDESVWHSSTKDSDAEEKIVESAVYIPNAGKLLTEYLNKRGVTTGVEDPDSVTPFKIISLADIKLRYIACKAALDESIKAGKAQFIQFRFWDQLKDLISQIEKIGEHDKLEDRDWYLIFFFD